MRRHWDLLFGVESGFFDNCHRLRRERFVQLDDVDIGASGPAIFNAFGIANTGPSPISSGLYPAVAKETKRASGLMPNALARSADITTAAAAPSDICDELPAVTVPFMWNAGFSASKASSEVSARGPSSTLKMISCALAWSRSVS